MRQISISDVVCYKLEASFSQSNTYEVSVTWGDGTTDTHQCAMPYYLVHTYQTAGIYTPTASITDIEKGCWKDVVLDTIYVFGVTLSATNNVITAGGDPGLTYTISGAKDIADGGTLSLSERWYFGDGNQVLQNSWQTRGTMSTQPYTVTLSGLDASTYSSDGTYYTWMEIKVSGPDTSPLYGYKEISNKIPIIVGGISPQALPSAVVMGVVNQETTTELQFLVTGSSVMDVLVSWGDDTTTLIETVSSGTLLKQTHSYPAAAGLSVYTITITVTDSSGMSSNTLYTCYVSPRLTIVPRDGNGCVATGQSQLSILYGGVYPITVYLEVAVQKGASIVDPQLAMSYKVDNATLWTAFPHSFLAGAHSETITNVSNTFELLYTHNMSFDSLNAFSVTAWARDANGRISDKIVLARCGNQGEVIRT